MNETKWQDISTAPRDGQNVLIYWADGNFKFKYGIAYFMYNEWFDAEGDDSFRYTPTHWQPLPEPPTS